jgi:tRNA(fMet)-specific endonuclease VapC
LTSHALDTNAAIALLNGKSAKLAQRLFAQAVGSVVLPTIVAHELYWGAFRSHHVRRNLESLRALAKDLPFLDFDANDARVAGEVRAALAARGAPIGPYDVLIAGQAKARGLVLVTNNLKEFDRVPGLTVEDWTR